MTDEPKSHLRQWRVAMKDRTTRIVTAGRVEAFGFYGLAFITGDIVVSVLPNGSYLHCDRIDPDTHECPDVVCIPASEAEGAENPRTRTKTAGKTKTQMIRTTPAGEAHYEQFEETTELGKLITCIDVDMNEAGNPMKDVRACWLEKYKGYPPVAYKKLNATVALALEQGMVEVFDVE